MREILFRGKHKDNGQWIYWHEFGRVTTSNGKGSKFTVKRGGSVSYYYHIDQILEKIDHATIGQYTGLTDKGGKKIFEGDVVRIVERGMVADGGIIIFENGYPGGWLIANRLSDSKCSLALRTDVEITGNIHDNPELLEGAET